MKVCVEQTKPEKLAVAVSGCAEDVSVVVDRYSLKVEVAANTSTVGSGSGGSSVPYQHIQSSASALWVINHNRGYKPLTKVYSPGGLEYGCEILNVSDNVTNVIFDEPLTGYSLST